MCFYKSFYMDTRSGRNAVLPNIFMSSSSLYSCVFPSFAKRFRGRRFSLVGDFQLGVNSHPLLYKGTTGNVWRHFWVSQPGVGILPVVSR